MKNKLLNLNIITCVVFIFLVKVSVGQDTTSTKKSEYVASKIYRVLKNDGSEYIGEIIEDNGRELLLNSKSIGKIYIPKHEIKSINLIETKEIINDEYAPENIYSTRYFFTTNGLSMKKKSHYALLTPIGPEAHFALTDHFTIGGITSWLGIPLVLSAKTTVSLGENVHFAVGTLLGTLSWADYSARGALPYAALTFGNQYSNITFSGGGLFLKNEESSLESGLFSIAGLVRVGAKTTFVFDSFIFR